ncbi:ABC-type multidrug transport system ATPase subunit [Roseimicrobium gellanilyticum]|uniref:ABC-type multidrug transport system ATPase subunit n=1 Tax=Roseimicrobium gellanilyticum TaxID=748857 RepID=A0A366H3M3_9BACT|nr:ATP-binding cassette domain-containing protein [Roseimicrobium gellanilyticum]RBP36580.1 ABC-type multidrug transport system ATPase subunit [Roseimicrobium gellanilyticum]
MLELKNISLSLDRDGEAHALLDDITFSIPAGHLLAIVGPSGCGKTTLMKTVAGLKHHDHGEIHWEGRNVEDEKDLHPSELGYVPQFSIAHDLLTVEECVASAVALRTRQPDEETAWALVETTLQQTGLTTLAERQVKVLSGGQRRRLGLALELVTNPTLLLCDEVTSGLDPKSEREITQLLHDLARSNPRRIVINVTHSLTNLSLFDTILVLHEGRVVYHGPPRALSHYFSVEQAEEIYPKLARRSSERWAESWGRHRDAYYATYGLAPKKDESRDKEKDKESSTGDLKAVGDREPDRIKLPSAATFPDEAEKEKEEEDEGDDWSKYKKRREKKQREEAREHVKSKKKDDDEGEEESAHPEVSEDHRLPGVIAQTRELLRRRWTIFWRDKTQLWLQLAMTLGFPLLVVIFGIEPIPQVRQLSVRQDTNMIANAKEQEAYNQSQLRAGSLVSGLILMQVVLVTLMASNNAAREIAGERDILERERLGGLRATSYVLSKVLFLGTFVLVQALWMGLFVEMVCSGIPGDLVVKLIMLVMASGAMTFVCLGISAIMRSPEKATILSIYLVGFQLPLSGALLALPNFIAPAVKPFIAAYWAWAGSLNSMKSTSFYDAVKVVINTGLEPWTLATFALGLHILVGLALTYAGTKNSQWD